MKPVLVIGRSGQVAQALAASGGGGVVCSGRPEVDLRAPDLLQRKLDSVRPVAVINAGGFTSVDGAESEPEAARALNVEGPGNLASACAERQIPLIHLSTDCVFDGEKPVPYTPLDQARPLGIYGQTKLQGEWAVRARAPRSLIVRVSWIFSEFGNNFVRTMLMLAQTRSSVTVVCDQVGCPSYAPALASGLLEMARQAAQPGFSDWGIYHVAGRGETDRANMARQIFEFSRRSGGPTGDVMAVRTADYPTPARRPLNARLDMSETTRVFGIDMPNWERKLEDTVCQLVEELAGP